MDIKSYALKQMTFFRNSEAKRFEFLDKKVGYRWIQSEELKQEPICYMIKFTQSQDGDEEFSLSLGRFHVLESELPYINYEKYTRLYHRGSLPQYIVASCQTYQKATLSEYSYKYQWSTSSNEKLTAFHNAVYGDYVDIGENQFSFPLDEPVESELKELFDCIQRTREDWAISMVFEMEADRKGLGEIESKQAYEINEIFIKNKDPYLRLRMLKLAEMYQQKDVLFKIELKTLFNELTIRKSGSTSLFSFFQDQLFRYWNSTELLESQRYKIEYR